MAEESKSPRRRKRTFSSCSTVSSDDLYHDASEQIVEDVTIEFFYKPRSITALSCLLTYLVYSAFTRDISASWEQNVWSGVVSMSVVFLVLSFLVMPNGPFIRPHPAIWRVVFGCSVLYLMLLAFALFQTRDDFRKILFFFDPELEKVGPDTKMYAVNCSQVTVAKIWEALDIFAFAHFFGWALKALLIRHAGLLWTASITWEVTEIFFSHLLPNFAECWWDAIILDVLLCNGLGIAFGLYVCKKLEMRNYHWESIKDIHTTTGKINRAVMQFTPASWTHVRWMDPKCSYMRYFAICQLLIISQIVELNTFFLKHILNVPTKHWLNWYRIFLISFTVAPSLRQYYIYVTDTRSKRVGTQCWVLIAITLLEALICVKYGLNMFESVDMIRVAGWLLFQMAISMGILYFMVMTKSRGFRGLTSKKTLEELPAFDSETKTISYLKANGHHMPSGRSKPHVDGIGGESMVGNGVEKHGDDLTSLDSEKDTGVVHKKKPRRSELPSSMSGYGIQTRLRSRKSQAGLVIA